MKPAGVLCLALLLSVSASAELPKTDPHGDPLPEHAVARLGTIRFRHAGNVGAVVYATDALISVGADGFIRFWDADDKELRRLEADRPLVGLAASRDGKVVAVVDDQHVIQAWDTGNGSLLFRSEAFQQLPAQRQDMKVAPVFLAMSPDGQYLAAGGGAPRNRLVVWHAKTGQPRWQNTDHESVIYCLAFTPDGQTVASTGHDGTIRFWESATGKLIRSCRRISEPINFIAFSADAKVLASCSHWEPEIRLWDAATGQDLKRLPGQLEEVHQVAFPGNGQLLALSYQVGGGGLVRHWDIQKGKPLHRLELDHDPHPAFALAGDGKRLALAQGPLIRRWQLPSWNEQAVPAIHQGAIQAVAVSPDGQRIATGSVDRTVCVWDQAGKLLHALRGHTDSVETLAFSPDAKWLATGSTDQTVRLWEAASGQEVHCFQNLGASVSAVAFSPDSQLLAAGSFELQVWQVAERTLLPGFSCQVRTIQAQAFSPDGRFLAVAGAEDPAIHLVESRTGKLIRKLTGRHGCISALAFSPDGKQLASGDSAGILQLWHIEDGKPFLRLGRHYDRVCGLAFSKEASVLLSTSQDGTARFWDASTSREVRPFLDEAMALAFSKDGQQLVTAGRNTTALVWSFPVLLRDRPTVRSRELSPTELDRLWRELTGGHGGRIGRAIRTLVASPEPTLVYLRNRLQPFFTDQFGRLIAELDHAQFDVRQRASEELFRLGRIVEPALQQALAMNPPLEVRQRVEALLERIRQQARTDEVTEEELFRYQMPALPAVEVLEKLKNPEARALLQRLANGQAAAPLTDEAKAALERLARP